MDAYTHKRIEKLKKIGFIFAIICATRDYSATKWNHTVCLLFDAVEKRCVFD